MEIAEQAYRYILDNQQRFVEAVQDHLTLCFAALLIGLAICIPWHPLREKAKDRRSGDELCQFPARDS